MCNACPGGSLSSVTKNRSADLVYSFPIEAPMKVLFVDIYAAGAELNAVGTKHYLIAACGMAYFAIAEDTAEQNSTVFASAIMRMRPLHPCHSDGCLAQCSGQIYHHQLQPQLNLLSQPCCGRIQNRPYTTSN
jgi:hypothetical protein